VEDARWDDFDAVWADVEQIGGWLTRQQAQHLWNEARALSPGALIVEIGSHQGRSTCVLARAVQPSGGRLVAIDPFVEGRLFGGQATRAIFEANVRANNVADVVHLMPRKSTSVRPTWTRSVDLLYIDGKHDYWTVSDDLLWSRVCRDGASVLLHDAFSSIGVTTSLVRHVLVGTLPLRYVNRDGSLAIFRVGTPTRSERRAMVRQLPWWFRNVMVKLALRLHLRIAARALGHQGDVDPF
jgi:predicted O-methyltransferase YrrM